MEENPQQNTIKKRSFALLRRHWTALALAVIVGGLCVAPPLYFALNSPNFASIQMMGADAEDHYAARINQVYEGFPTIGNTFLPQKEVPYILPGLGENIVATIGMALKLTAPEAVVFSKFIFPLIAALLAYALAYLLFNSRAAALIGTSFIMLGDGLISGPAAWLALLRGSSVNNSFLVYARPINPEISGILLFGGLIAIYLTFLANRQIKKPLGIISCGILTGASLYVSPYVFTFLVAAQVICFIYLILKRDRKRAISALIVGTITAIVIIPFFLNYLELIASPAYSDSVMRTGLIGSRALILGLWIPIMILCGIFFMPRRYKKSRVFFIVCALALLVVVNQQILTGKMIQPGHYHWYITTPLVGILIGMYVATFCQRFIKNRGLRYAAYFLIIAVIICNGVTTQINSYGPSSRGAIALQRYAPIFDYLNSLSTKEFVWANNDISTYISIYTHDDNANSPQALNYLIPKSYFVQRLFLNYRLRNINPKDVLATMKNERENVSSVIYALYWRDQKGSFGAIPDPEIDSLAAEYSREYAKPLEKVFSDLGITIIVWDKAGEPYWKIDSQSFAKKLYSSGTIDVYRVVVSGK